MNPCPSLETLPFVSQRRVVLTMLRPLPQVALSGYSTSAHVGDS
jgi:hypothetical protein